MPPRYRETFDGAAMRQHAAIIARRGEDLAHVEVWKREPHDRAVLCVAAEDKPGLLSLISASLAAHHLDVITAQAYTRAAQGTSPPEAVDFLWVRRDAEPTEPVRSSDAAAVEDTLKSLLRGEVSLESVSRRARRGTPVPPGAATRVTFDETPSADLAVLTVETFDRPGLLLTITLALFRARVQIIASDATTEKGQVVDRFTIAELDGSPVVKNRRGAVQTAVLAAIDAIADRRLG